jgi:hypothetical protein
LTVKSIIFWDVTPCSLVEAYPDVLEGNVAAVFRV